MKCVISLVVFAAVVVLSNIGQVESAILSQCDMMCMDLYAPVCGSDGVTYSNGCYLSIANCGKPDALKVTVASQGACGGASSEIR
ncbi:uncharacterized protein LOC131951593 [Physella acuta]|uniref:uncharacterized protein LOC131951593 n=1 Tax=Physella acuta TaxID=109671 RepID=UPI0027DD207C|nr:uncharacterized protein LOC131951593 [Physella acuta]